MTGPDELRAHTEALGINLNDVACLTGVEIRTVRRWAAGDANLPASVVTLFCVMRKYGLSVNQVMDARERHA